ncbi:MAG TPA: hydroxymethylbilane synthase [Rhodopila sp.]|nr:hydroxymethylbilane synthase [Rhodopila sp.]
MNTRPPENPSPRVRAGTRGSPLALYQTRLFLSLLQEMCAEPAELFQEQIIATTGDAVQDRALAEIGGKGLFAKEIHEALLDGRVNCAVHSLKDLETELPPGIVLACTLPREDPRDVLIFGEAGPSNPDPADPYAALPAGATIGTSSVRRQAQLLAARPDLRVVPMRGNVQTRLRKLGEGVCQASLLALAGLKRLGMELPGAVVLQPEAMVPAAGQGIIGITARADDTAMLDLCARLQDAASRIVAEAERAMLGVLDGSCRTPIGANARIMPDGQLILTGLVARADGSFLLKRSVHGALGGALGGQGNGNLDARFADAAALGRELGESLRADAPSDLFP